MEERFGFILPIYSYDKGRSGDLSIANGSGGGCVVHDKSYFSTLKLKSSELNQRELLNAIGRLTDPGIELDSDFEWKSGCKAVSWQAYEA